MTALLIAATLLTPQSSTFFPLESGQTWEYTISIANSVMRVRQTQKSLPVQDYDGSPAAPLEIYLEGKIDSTGYYRVIDGFICLVGMSGGAKLPEPSKLVPIDPKRGQTWSVRGQTLMLGMTVSLKSDSRVTKDEQIDILGKRVRAITIETKSEIGDGEFALITQSTDVYAEGIGMVTRRQESTPGKNSKRKSIAVTTIVSHEKAGG